MGSLAGFQRISTYLTCYDLFIQDITTEATNPWRWTWTLKMRPWKHRFQTKKTCCQHVPQQFDHWLLLGFLVYIYIYSTLAFARPKFFGSKLRHRQQLWPLPLPASPQRSALWHPWASESSLEVGHVETTRIQEKNKYWRISSNLLDLIKEMNSLSLSQNIYIYKYHIYISIVISDCRRKKM